MIAFNTNYDNVKYTNLKTLIFSKIKGYGNYIDVSKFFKEVKAVLITPWVEGTSNNYIMTYIRTTEDLKIIYRSCCVTADGNITEQKSYNIDEQNFYGSCVFLVIGY